MKKLSLVFLFFFILSNSCYYIDSDSYAVEVTPTYHPTPDLSSNLDGLDSILLTDSMYFRYEIDIDTAKLFFADLYLGSFQILRSVSLTDSLWIFPFFITADGEYDLTLVAYYKTYTGSLADIVNAEFSVSDTSWPISVYRDLTP